MNGPPIWVKDISKPNYLMADRGFCSSTRIVAPIDMTQARVEFFSLEECKYK